MCELVNIEVIALKRVRVGPLKLGRLEIGKWRYLSKIEVEEF
jgi:23S rRNA pseudouridine2604 synthase